MLIDWFTVGAQIVNFLILVYLLKRFLYGPIVKAINEREERVLGRLREAEALQAKADQQAVELAGERKELAAAREKMLVQAREDAEQWRDQAQDRARKEIDAMRRAWEENLRADQESFISRLKTRISDLVFQVSEKALKDLADGTLEASAAERFMKEVAEQDNKALPELLAKGQAIVIRSGFDLAPETRDRLSSQFNAMGLESPVEFKIETAIGFGIQLLAGDRKIEWSLNRYLREMEEEVLSVLRTSKGSSDESLAVTESA